MNGASAFLLSFWRNWPSSSLYCNWLEHRHTGHSDRNCLPCPAQSPLPATATRPRSRVVDRLRSIYCVSKYLHCLLNCAKLTRVSERIGSIAISFGSIHSFISFVKSRLRRPKMGSSMVTTLERMPHSSRDWGVNDLIQSTFEPLTFIRFPRDIVGR